MSVQPFDPFTNESDVLTVGDLSLENRMDRIIIIGNVDITRDLAGLEAATMLRDQLEAVTAALRREQKSGRLPGKVAEPIPDELVPNPFQKPGS